MVLLCASGLVRAQVEVVPPLVTGAPDAGSIWNESPVELGEYGLQEKEFFFEGSTTGGNYKSRMIVRRPANPWRFNGTVIVEWMNASSGLDIDVDFLPLLPLIARHGYAYVAVTAQAGPVNFLKNHDAVRYGALSLDSDNYAHEVFSQAAKALLSNNEGAPLEGLHAKRLIAIGQSQSSMRLTSYVDTVHGLLLEPLFDGFVPHAGGGAPTRFPVPVFKVNSESEAPGYFGMRDVADENYRYWEIPGTAHQPLESNDYALNLLLVGRGSTISCPFPFEGPGGPVATGTVLRAAVHHLNRWIIIGKQPPTAPLIDMLPNPSAPGVGIIQRDQYGNALGGIRMPQVEVPTARIGPSYACIIRVPFPPYQFSLDLQPQYDAFDGNNDPAVDPTDVYVEPDSVEALYPSHGRYVRQFTRATIRAMKQGYILPADANRLIVDAVRSDIGKAK